MLSASSLNKNISLSLSLASIQAMNLLYGIKHDMCNHDACAQSPLRAWLQNHGEPSVKKFYKLTPENNYSGPLVFQAETEENNFVAYIDPENIFSMTDKFAQVINPVVTAVNICLLRHIKTSLIVLTFWLLSIFLK